jgi:hypothetical protein
MDTIDILAVLVLVSFVANLLHWRWAGTGFLLVPRSSLLRGTLVASLVAYGVLGVCTLLRLLPGVVGGVVLMVGGITQQVACICSRHARRPENAAA